jgi:hypothetical protein
MTNTPAKPKRGRWRWLVVVVVAMFCAHYAYRTAEALSKQREWVSVATDRQLEARLESVSSVPVIRDSQTLKRMFGNRIVVVTVRTDGQADSLLTMPPCPGELSIFTTGKGISYNACIRLAERFGKSVH